MIPGTMRRRITIQNSTPTQNTSGDMVPSWGTYYTCWAEIQPATGRELMAAAQVQANISHTITIRWPGTSYTISPSMRVLYKSRYFDIQAVINLDERNRTLQLLCLERVGET